MENIIKKSRLKSLFRNMVDIYSPSGKEEDITEFLASYLHEKGLPVTLREVSDGRRNVEVVFSDKAPSVAFIGHIDTVPAFDIDDYEFAEQDGRVYGLGTADMKGGCAAMIEAFVSQVQTGRIPHDAGLFLVVGEEETGDGTAALIKSRSFPWAIVAEPTDLAVCLGHYGYSEMLVQSHGTRRHASLGSQQYNAVFSMLQMLLKLAEFITSDYSQVVMNIRDIHSSSAGFAVPGSCESFVDFHLPPEIQVRKITKKIKALVEEAFSDSLLTNYSIEFPTMANSYQLEDKGLLPEILQKIYGQLGYQWHPTAFRSHSDANLLWQANCSPIILGPGQLEAAHTRDESIDFEQVVQAAQLYREILESLISRSK
ncbi:MAG: M20/M25/M40 family metallo-hydrolase [Phycisphaerae bacterium]|nr:M20/M25/M40 family metallo-hydrolase [Phycisphaerae bacterium]